MKNDGNLAAAERELLLSMDKAYDLYHSLLLLIVLLTDAEQKRIDNKRFKPFLAELDNNMRLYDNRFAEQLRINRQLQHFANEKGVLWTDDGLSFVKLLLKKVLASDIYTEYTASPDSYEADKTFWRKAFTIIIEDEDFRDFIENSSLYWIDDLDIVSSFVFKTIRRFNVSSGADAQLLPMFRESVDRDFAVKLLRYSILEGKENKERITGTIKNWDIERLAQTDLLIMQIALAELRNFPEIPVCITLNEYIDISRYYSTPKSPAFINGALDAIAKDMQREGLFFKN
jgi:N utilization substance protein B